jgi:hypothetical protein
MRSHRTENPRRIAALPNALAIHVFPVPLAPVANKLRVFRIKEQSDNNYIYPVLGNNFTFTPI